MNEFTVGVRKTTAVILIVSVAILTLLAILSIWDLLESNVLAKAIESMALIGSISLIFLVSAKVMLSGTQIVHSRLGIGWIILIIFGALLVLPSLISTLFFGFRGFD